MKYWRRIRHCWRRSPRIPAAHRNRLPRRLPTDRRQRTRPRCFRCRSEPVGAPQDRRGSKAAWSSTVHTTGTVDWDADHTTQAITQVSGPISRLLVDMGTPVTVNQPLLYVSSPDVANAISTYRKARNHLDYAKRTLDRNKDLLDHKVIAMKDLEAAQQDYNDARARTSRTACRRSRFSASRNRRWTMPSARACRSIRNWRCVRRSPGVVVQKLVSPGLVIQAGMTACFTISDVSTVWVQGHIYDRDLEVDSDRRRGRGNQFLVQADLSRHGFLHRSLVDPATRTTSVRIVTQNSDGMLKKDMFVDAVIHTGSGRSVLTVPTSAHSSQRRKPAVRVRGGRAGKIRAAAGEHRRRARRGNGDGERMPEGEKIVAEGVSFFSLPIASSRSDIE